MGEKAAHTPEAALVHALHRKNTQSKEDCVKEGLKFLALPVEVLGGFAAQTVEVVNHFGKQLGGQSGHDEALVTNHL